MSSRFWGGIPVMWLSGLFAALVVISLFNLSAAAYAEEIIYTGDGKSLRNSPSWVSEKEGDFCLFLGTNAAPLSSGNKVTVNYNPNAAGVHNPDFIFGGLSETENVMDNSIVLLNGRNNIDIYGGYSIDGTSEGNTVTVSGGSVGYSVLGGFSKYGNAVGNKVFLNGGAVGMDVRGGMSFGGSGNTAILDNVVTIRGGYVAAIAVGGVGVGHGIVARNIVTISGGSVYSDVYGGCGDNHVTAGNTVKIEGGSIDGIVCGGFSRGGGVLENRVIISGGLINGSVSGGHNREGIAANNTVTVSGGSVRGHVYGGGSYDGDATNNSVTISGRPDMTDAYIWGGYTSDASGNSFTGNTLKLNSSGISVKGVGNFEYYNFYLPESIAAGEVILSVTETVDLKGATVGVSLEGNSKLRKGDKITLIHSKKGIVNSPKNKNCQAKSGSASYEFSFYTDSNNLWAEVTKISNAAK